MQLLRLFWHIGMSYPRVHRPVGRLFGHLLQDDLERELGKLGLVYEVRREAYREALLIETASGIQFGYHLGKGEAPPATALQFISLSRQERAP